MNLVTRIYLATRSFPKTEIYGLTNQLRRAAVSVPSNLAEGYGRFSRKELRVFIGRARGSLLEVETQLEIAQDLDFLDSMATEELLTEAREIGRMLNGLKVWGEAPVPDN
jgi:four helix bundle protein